MFKLNFLLCTVGVLLSFIVEDSNAVLENVTMEVNRHLSIYYNTKDNSTFRIETADASRLPFEPIKFIARGLPCSCSNLKCGCCTGINITMISFNRLACTNITVVPETLALEFDIMMDDKKVFTNRVSASNPPPACVPLYFLPAITFCVRFFDLGITEGRFNACIDFETRIVALPILVLHFNCVKLGGSGVTWVRPGDNGQYTSPPIIANATDPEVYDHVNFEISDNDPEYLHTSTLTPEQEDQIGTLKL